MRYAGLLELWSGLENEGMMIWLRLGVSSREGVVAPHTGCPLEDHDYLSYHYFLHFLLHIITPTPRTSLRAFQDHLSYSLF